MGTLTETPAESRSKYTQQQLLVTSTQSASCAADSYPFVFRNSYQNVSAHGRQRLRQGRVGDVQPCCPQHPDRGGSGGSGGEGGPVYQSHGGQQADSHRGAG